MGDRGPVGDTSSASTFGIAYPRLRRLAGFELGGPELEPVIRTPKIQLDVLWMEQNGVRTVGDLMALQPEDPVRWPGASAGRVARVDLFVRRLDDAVPELVEAILPTGQEPPVSRRADVIIGDHVLDLRDVVEWVRFSSGATSVGEALHALSEAGAPADVAAVVQEVLDAPLPASEVDPLGDVAMWISGLSDREEAILRKRVLGFESATLDEIGHEFGVTRERIRQLEKQLRDDVASWLRSSRGRSARWALHLIANGLGSCAPDTEVPLVGTTGGQSDEFALLLHLADMVWDRDAGVLHARRFTWPQLGEVPLVEGGPVVDEVALAELLADRGVVPQHTSWVIDRISGMRRVEGTLVLWPRSMVEQSVAVLTLAGVPLTDDDIVERIGRQVNVRGLRDRLMNDPRVIRVTKDEFALAAWGLPEYGGIAASMVQRIEELGAVPLPELADYLAERHGIKRASVFAYASAPVFVLDGGRLRLRRADEPYTPVLDPPAVPGLFRVDSGRTSWLIEVDHDVLRGSGRACPVEVATEVGVSPGRSEVLSNPVRNIRIGWARTSHMGPTISSLRPHAQALGAREGDILRLVMDRGSHSVTAELAELSGEPVEVFDKLLGRRTSRISRSTIARAIGLESADEVVGALRARGDARLADLAEALES